MPDDMTGAVDRIVAALYDIRKAIEDLPVNYFNTPISSVMTTSAFDSAEVKWPVSESTTPSPPGTATPPEKLPSSEEGSVWDAYSAGQDTYFSGGKMYRKLPGGNVEPLADESRGINIEVWQSHARYVRELKGMLRRLQWIGEAYGAGMTCSKCPICGGMPEDTKLHVGAGSYEHGRGHTPDCELAKLLNERREGD